MIRKKNTIWTYSSRPFGQVDMNIIHPKLDSAFISLYSDYFGMTRDDSLKKLYAYMGAPSHLAFDLAKDNGTVSEVSFGDEYFENYTPIWNDLLKKNKKQLGLSYWVAVLEIVREWEKSRKCLLHKGTLYYFASVTAAELRDFDSTMILMHLALQEDKANNVNWKNTPANSFLTLNVNKDQFYKTFVEAMVDFIRDRLDGQGASNGRYKGSYRSKKRGSLTYDEMRSKFLENYDEGIEQIKYYFIYATLKFWHTRENQKVYIKDSIMSPLIYADILNSLLLVLECLLAEKLSTKEGKSDLHGNIQKLKIGAEVSNVNSNRNSSFTTWFENTLKKDSIAADFELCYGLRNFTFHNIKRQEYLASNYTQINQALFNCIFYTLEKLY